MDVPCARAPVSEGEATRSRLDEADLLDHGHDIVVEDAEIYIPVTDPAAVPDDLEVVFREVPSREPQRTPADLLGFEPSYERLGDVILLDEDAPERAREIAEAVIESDIPARAVLNRASKVKGELRVRDWDVLVDRGEGDGDGRDDAAGDDGTADEGGVTGSDATDDGDAPRSPTETVHREYGFEYLLDVASVYFSPRLATERHRVAERVEGGERAFDMFAGVGPFAIPFAARGAEVVAVDLNPEAVRYLRTNAERNGVTDRIEAIEGDVREVAADYRDWADRIVMNLPHSADEFLDAAVAVAGEDCVVHYYDIQDEDDPFGPGEAAIRAAAEPDYEVTVETEHVVRSYAPHELNVCLDVWLRKK